MWLTQTVGGISGEELGYIGGE